MEGKSFLKGIITGVLTTVIIAGLIFTGYYIKSKKNTVKVSEETVRKINEINKIIDKKFLFDVKPNDMEEMAIKGYVAGLKDPYSVYYTAEEYI